MQVSAWECCSNPKGHESSNVHPTVLGTKYKLTWDTTASDIISGFLLDPFFLLHYPAWKIFPLRLVLVEVTMGEMFMRGVQFKVLFGVLFGVI